MKDGIAIKKDITAEAKEILFNAMNNFCKPSQNKEEKAKNAYIAQRQNYWLELGYDLETATKKANEDFDWVNS